MKWVYGATVVLVAIAIAAAGFAYGPGSGGRHHGGHGRCGQEWGRLIDDHEGMAGFGQGRAARLLGLSRDQIDKMTELQKRYSRQVDGLREDLVRKRIEARTLFTDPRASEEAIVAKEKEMDAIREKLRDSLVQLRLEQRRILSPEQLKKLTELRPELDLPGRDRQVG